MKTELKARLKRLEAQAGAGREKPRLRFVTVEGKPALLSGGLALSKDALKKSLAGYYRAADRDIERLMIMPRPSAADPAEDETLKLKREIRELEAKRRELRARKAAKEKRPRKKREIRPTGKAGAVPRLLQSLLKRKDRLHREVSLEKRKATK